MDNKTQLIKQHADYLRLTFIRNQAEALLHQAQLEKPGYTDFAYNLLSKEVEQRQKSDLEKRMKLARLPKNHNLDGYDCAFSQTISKAQLKDLRELLWVDQIYNLILMGASGTGKTYLASGLIHDAVIKGYKAYFIAMDELINILKMKEITATALSAYNRLLKADVVAVDDIMMFPLKKHEALDLFNLINHLHEQCSLIITTNKSPKQWADTLEDEVLASALLDRILYRCEVINFKGDSYRMENRKTIFYNKYTDDLLLRKNDDFKFASYKRGINLTLRPLLAAQEHVELQLAMACRHTFSAPTSRASLCLTVPTSMRRRALRSACS